MKMYLEALRLPTWLKNLVVLIPLFLSQQFFDAGLLGRVLITVVLVCLLSSATYLINDLFDGKKFEGKRSRRIVYIILALVLVLLSLAGGFFITAELGLVLLAFFVLSLWYSSWLKNVLVLDVLVVVAGMLLRVYAGGIVLGITPSVWIMLVVACGTLLGMSLKRLSQKRGGVASATLALPESFFQQLTMVSAGLLITSYILMTQLSNEIAKSFRDTFVVAGLFVMFIAFRAAAHAFMDTKKSPLARDYSLWIAGLLGIVLIALKMYFM